MPPSPAPAQRTPSTCSGAGRQPSTSTSRWRRPTRTEHADEQQRDDDHEHEVTPHHYPRRRGLVTRELDDEEHYRHSRGDVHGLERSWAGKPAAGALLLSERGNRAHAEPGGDGKP